MAAHGRDQRRLETRYINRLFQQGSADPNKSYALYNSYISMKFIMRFIISFHQVVQRQVFEVSILG